LPAFVVYLARANLLPEARRSLADMGDTFQPGVLDFLQGEIAVAGGDLDDGIGRFERSLDALKASNDQWRLPLASESLASALRKKGNLKRAIEVLEQGSEKRVASAFERAGAYWLRIRFDLSRLYRETGRGEDARRIERELSALLAFADADHPIRRELDRLKGS
jgi:tetratricopeptide (TPR) repeat protein